MVMGGSLVQEQNRPYSVRSPGDVLGTQVAGSEVETPYQDRWAVCPPLVWVVWGQKEQRRCVVCMAVGGELLHCTRLLVVQYRGFQHAGVVHCECV